MEKVNSVQNVDGSLAIIGKDNKSVTNTFGFMTKDSAGFITKTRQFGAWLTGGAPVKPATHDVKMLTVFGPHSF